jgi:hypothetical protein
MLQTEAVRLLPGQCSGSLIGRQGWFFAGSPWKVLHWKGFEEARMALWNNGVKLGTGLAIGVGALILAPTVLPAVAAVLKPLAKAAIKSGFIIYEKSREVLAETKEVIEDLAAEARAELSQEVSGAGFSVDTEANSSSIVLE